jgi:hypothetical protein
MLPASEERLRILRAKQAFGRRIRRRKPACLDCMRSGSPEGIDALLATECAIVNEAPNNTLSPLAKTRVS